MVCLAAGLAAGCGHAPGRPRTDLPPADQITLGRRALEDGDEYQAQLLLRGYLEREPAGEKADEAHFLLGLSYFRTKEWPSAATEFSLVLSRFSGSVYAPDASYHLCVSYWRQSRKAAYDQDYTRLAITQFERFLSLYPDHPKAAEIRGLREEALTRLAKKDYENGRLYLKMGYLEPARFYFREVQHKYPGTSWAHRAALGEAKSWMKEKRWQEAIPVLERLEAESPPRAVASEARRLLAEARRKAGQEQAR